VKASTGERNIDPFVLQRRMRERRARRKRPGWQIRILVRQSTATAGASPAAFLRSNSGVDAQRNQRGEGREAEHPHAANIALHELGRQNRFSRSDVST